MATSRKLALAVRDDLAPWQKLNVTSFVVSGFGPAEPQVMGEPYIDGSGREYPPILGLPVRIFTGDAAGIRRAFERGLDRDVLLSVYIDEMFSTMNDKDNRAAVSAVATSDLIIAGFAVAGEGKQVDKVFDKLKLHP